MRSVLVLALCLWTGIASAATIDIKVYDAFGSAYSTTQIGEQLGALYNLDFNASMVLVLGPDLTDERVTAQEDILAAIDPSEHGILFAIGTPGQTYTRGFNVAPNTAADLLPDPGAFRVLFLGPTGEVLFDADEVVAREQLIEIAGRQ